MFRQSRGENGGGRVVKRWWLAGPTALTMPNYWPGHDKSHNRLSWAKESGFQTTTPNGSLSLLVENEPKNQSNGLKYSCTAKGMEWQTELDSNWWWAGRDGLSVVHILLLFILWLLQH